MPVATTGAASNRPLGAVDTSPSLGGHFHDEIQITVVLAGAQIFLTPVGPIAVQAGETAVIDPTCRMNRWARVRSAQSA